MPLARKTAWYGCLEGAHSLLVATDLAKQRLKMTTFLGLFGTETLVSICEDVFEHREEGCWRRLKHGALPNAEAPRHREQLYEHEIAMHKVTQKLMAANSLDPRRGQEHSMSSPPTY